MRLAATVASPHVGRGAGDDNEPLDTHLHGEKTPQPPNPLEGGVLGFQLFLTRFFVIISLFQKIRQKRWALSCDRNKLL